MHYKNYALMILGPTGVGKSESVELLAKKIPVEIINMDIGSFYTRLKIGTAKPDWKRSPIMHHMFDVIDKPESLSVTQYRFMMSNVLNEVWSRGKLPILVGGSGFYLKSLLFPPQVYTSNVTKKKEKLCISWEKLNEIDPDRAKHIHPNDTYRITRALELWTSTGKRPSELVPAYAPLIVNYDVVYLTRDREELYTRINSRIKKMMRQGLVEEVYKLYNDPQWNTFLLRKKIIGYNDFFPFFDQYEDKNTLLWQEEVADKIGCRTRSYARRQAIFWNMLQKMLHSVGENKDTEINLSHIDPMSCVKKIETIIHNKKPISIF